MAGFINIAIVAACSARCLSPSTKETEKCQTLLLIFFITTTVAPYLSSKWLRWGVLYLLAMGITPFTYRRFEGDFLSLFRWDFEKSEKIF